MKNKYIFTAVLLFLLTAVGTGIIHTASEKPAAANKEEECLKIVTSFYPMYIAAKNVVGDVSGVELSNLTEPQTGCLHDYQLTPQDLILLSDADVFVINGGGIESFLDDVTANYPELQIVTASEGIPYLGTAHETDGHDHEHYHGDGHDHGDINAHVWMDVSRYMQEVETIAEALETVDPVHGEQYHKNAHAYMDELEALEQKLQELKGLAVDKKAVIFHDAFAYFAEAFDLEVAGVIAMDGETSFSANQVSEIVHLIKQEQIDMLFTEEQYGTKLADVVSRETNANVYVLDSLVTGEADADSYLNGMYQNLEVLRKAFGEEE